MFFISNFIAFFIKAAKVFIILGMNKPSVLFMFKREK
jgi:hypothetical protein